MREILNRTGLVAMIAGLAFAAAACSDSEPASDVTTNNALDSNLLFEEPANDASAMESVGNAVEPAPELTAPDNAATANNSSDEAVPGDSGGDTVESNVSGM
ncbi:MAG: hypothetical protein ACXWUN_02085 [Allosphingosinicella sp.]